MVNYQSTKSKSQESHHLGLSGSPELQFFELPDQSFMKQTTAYSIFANKQAMNSNLSLSQTDYMHTFNSSEVGNFHQNDITSNSDFLPNIYGFNEFEFNNASFESLPAISDKTSQSHSQFDLVDTPDWHPYPYTPTFLDNHLSNFSERSFTSDFVDNQFLQNMPHSQTSSVPLITHQVPQLVSQNAHMSHNLQQFSQVPHSLANSLQQTPVNPNSIAKRQLSMQMQPHSNNSPHSTILLSYQHMSGRSTPIAINTNFNESPTPSSNLHHAITYGAGSSTNSSSGPQQPPSLIFNSPSTATSASPIASLQQYKMLDMNSPILPPQHAFRHNSDSSFNSTTSSIESPRRYPSQLQPLQPTSHKLPLHHNNSNLEISTPISTPLSKIKLSKKSSVSSLSSSDVSKPKKYTRQRILPRSKDGCWICRIKHLKCDECKPVCKSCERFGIECDYSIEKPLYVSDKNLRREKLASITQVRGRNTAMPRKKSSAKLV